MKKSELTDLKKIILHHGIDRGLQGLASIARWLGYNERTFQIKVQTRNFRLLELIDLAKRLEFTDEEILLIMGRE